MAKFLKNSEKNKYFTFDSVTKRVTYHGDLGTIQQVYLPNHLGQMLGFQYEAKWTEKEVFEADNAIDLEMGLNGLFVYTDIMTPRLVGDSLVPLLRIVEVNSGHYGEMVTHIYDKHQYFTIGKSDLDSIEIQIKDDAGQSIRFQNGKVYVTLHFRPSLANALGY